MDIADATGLPAAARKLQQVVSAAPRMEAWIGQVCEALYGSSSGVGVGGPPPLCSLLVSLAPGGLAESVKKVGGVTGVFMCAAIVGRGGGGCRKWQGRRGRAYG